MACEPVASSSGANEPALCRKLALSDTMILLVGTAVWLAMGAHLGGLLSAMLVGLGRDVAANLSHVFIHWSIFWNAIHFHFVNSVSYFMQLSFTFLLSMTPAFFVVRLKRPRPGVSKLLGQPGMVAAVAMIFGLLWVTGSLYRLFPELNTMTTAPIAVGGSVALAWILLVLSRNWRPERGWIDRMGRFLGYAAIVNALVAALMVSI
jgi:hypothetical protein